METMAFFFALIALGTTTALSNKVSKLERQLKDLGGSTHKESLLGLLQKNIGSTATLIFEENSIDVTVAPDTVTIIDVDSSWIHIKTTKKGIEKLVALNAIKSVKLN